MNITRKLSAVLSTAGLLCTLTLSAGIVLAANPSANLDQCANDPAPSLSINGCATNANQWVNGNLNASKSLYNEGDSIAYRMRFDNLTLAPGHTVKIEWDTTKSSKHALDYITTWNRTVADANPCLGITGCGAGLFASTIYAIPADPQVTGAGVTPAAGNFTFFGATITAVSPYFYSTGSGFTGDKSAGLILSFTPSVKNPVLAWGGHIATRPDWGVGNSAVAISGSPYHTRLLDLDGAGGNQDRSLSADAVVFPGSITIKKHASPEGSTAFGFAASASSGSVSPAVFSLTDTSASEDAAQALDDAVAGGGITNFVTYTVSENDPGSNWSLASISCSVTSANGGSQNTNTGTRTATISLKEGENVTCTFNNNFIAAPGMTIDKSFVSVTGGTANAAGDVITYSIVVTNTGNVSLTGVSVNDPLLSNEDCDGTAGVPYTNTGLTIAVGGHLDCTGSYTLTQTDLDNNGGSDGDIDNTATADSDQTGPSSDSVAVPLVRTPHLTITKTATEQSYDSVGDVINYTIVATNDGNVTLAAVTISDPNVSNLTCIPVNGSSLAPGASMNCTATHTVSQADIDFGPYANTACVDDGVGAGGAAQVCDSEDVPSIRSPLLAITKVDTFDGKFSKEGDILTFTITATNDGNVTLHNVVVTDSPTLDDFSCTPSVPVANLAPGATITCTGTHTVNATDIANKYFDDTACVDDGAGGAAQACDDNRVDGKNQPTIGTQDAFVPQDTITLSGLSGDTTGGDLHVVLRIGGTSCTTGILDWEYTWLDAGNNVYHTTDVVGQPQAQPNPISANSDTLVRWCSEYSGNADNAARTLSDHNEVALIDFDPTLGAALGGAALPLLAWALWNRRRREEEKAA